MGIKNTVIFLLTAAVLMQSSCAKPKPENTSIDIAALKKKDLCLQKTKYDMEPSADESEQYPTLQLGKFSLRNIQHLSLRYAKNAKNISDQLLRDSEILNAKSDKLLQFKQNLTKFEEKFYSCDGIDDLIDLGQLYSNCTSFYFELDETSLHDDDTKLISKLLRKYGSEDLDNETWELFRGFADKFNEKVDELKEGLEKEPNDRGKKMLERSKDWYALVRSKKISSNDDRNDVFKKFFTIFIDDKEGQ